MMAARVLCGHARSLAAIKQALLVAWALLVTASQISTGQDCFMFSSLCSCGTLSCTYD